MKAWFTLMKMIEKLDNNNQNKTINNDKNEAISTSKTN